MNFGLERTYKKIQGSLAACLLLVCLSLTHITYAGDIVGKLIVGYQGWFACKNDGTPMNKWNHWSGSNGPAPGFGKIHFDLYPDVREYSTTYQTGLANLGNGQPSKLFTSYSDQVVNKHVEWMQQYGIDVVALQRFSSGVTPGSSNKAHKDGMATKIKNACEIYGRKFYIMYDLSDMAMDTSFINILRKDWTNTIRSAAALNLLASPAYAKEMVGGELKPVVCIWGVGSADRPGDNTSWTTIINWFKQQGCYVIVGGDKEWRTKPDVKAACENAHMISPWHVGTFNNSTVADWGDRIAADLTVCKNHVPAIDYMPVLWPGFSWANWKLIDTNGDGVGDTPATKNNAPRMHGNFMWEQFYTAKAKGITNVYVAMFDEYDEGTAIAKAAENASMIPTNQWFLTLDADETACSSDFYLRLVNDGAKMMRGEIALTSTHPTVHTTASNIAVTSIRIAPTTSIKVIGSEVKLTATVIPVNATNIAVNWAADNTSVATVSSTGVVTAVAVGTANIIATTQDGAKTAKMVITVTAPILVTSVSVTPATAAVNVGSTPQLTATVLPSNATNKKCSWMSNDTTIAKVSTSGLVTAVAFGIAIITATTEDGAKTATSTITVNPPTSIEDFNSVTQKPLVSIYPNPLNQNMLTIKMEGYEESGDIEVKITDLLGHKVYKNTLRNSKILEINTADILKSSIYFVTLKSGESINNLKLVVR